LRPIITLTLLVAGLLPDHPVIAQTPGRLADQVTLTAADRVALERLALARARVSLHDRIRALELSDNLTIGDWAADQIALDRALRAWTRSRPRFAAPRFYSDGACDVDIRVTANELRDQLLAWQTDFDRKTPTSAVVRKTARKWPAMWHTGSAASAENTRTAKPLGWENIRFDGIQLARRAAKSDAYLALLSEAARLQVTNARRLADFLSSSDAVRDAVLAAIERTAHITARSETDQVVTASASIAIPDLIRILIGVHAEHYKGDLFHAADFREMALLARKKELRAIGLGVPPRSTRTKPKYEPIELDQPPWAIETLDATGRYDPSDEDGDLDGTVRVELARLNGMDALRREVEALVIQKDVTIEQFLGHRRELKSDVVLFLTGARLMSASSSASDGAVEVRVKLPLKRLWLIVGRGMTLQEVDPPEPRSAP
jgi:Arc/MetJ-type ribon-helix-helix transcriptional regulator